MKDSKAFWDRSASKYARSPVQDQETYQKKLAITQEYFQPEWSVLEFGCGTGSTALAHAPYVKQLLATDISDQMLEIAKRKAQAAGIENICFQQGTLDSLELKPESFDAVLGLNILHLLENVDMAISRVHEVLKPGGLFVSSTALLTEMSVVWRWLIPVMQLLGLAPYVNYFNQQTLLSLLTYAGFSIDHQWQPKQGSIFIIARKHG